MITCYNCNPRPKHDIVSNSNLSIRTQEKIISSQRYIITTVNIFQIASYVMANMYIPSMLPHHTLFNWLLYQFVYALAYYPNSPPNNFIHITSS